MRLSPPVRAGLWMLLCASSFAGTLVCIRALAGLHTAVEIFFYRVLVGVALMAPWCLRPGLASFKRAQIPAYLYIAFFAIGAQVAWNWAIVRMPLLDATALNFTLPLFATLFAAIFFAERVGRARATALAAGFAGVLVVLRPGLSEVGLPAFVALACAGLFAASYILLKILTRVVRPDMVTFNFHLVMLPIVLGLSAFEWTWPAAHSLIWAFGVGLFGTMSYFGLMRALALMDTGYCMIYDFARLPFATIAGILIFAERPDVWTFIGAAVIFASAYINARRETARARIAPKAVDA